jgi:hypothetical protein
LNFILDTGASEVNIPAEVALTLYHAGTIGHNALRADFGYLNPGLRDQFAARLRHTCPV